MDIEDTIGMKIMKEVAGDLEKGHIQVTSEGMTETVVIVGQGQDQVWVLTEAELGVISVESMIISQKIVQRRKRDKSNTADVQSRQRANIITNISYRYIW